MHQRKNDLNTPLLVILLLFLLASNAQAVRLNELTSPVPGQGTSNVPADEAITCINQLSAEARQIQEDALLNDFLRDLDQNKAKSSDTIGGDDVIVAEDDRFNGSDIDIAQNGDIYIAVQLINPTTGYGIEIYRSQDSGDSFSLWGALTHSTYNEGYTSPSIEVSEGAEDRFYIAYKRFNSGQSSIRVSYAELAGSTATWSSEIIALSSTGVSFNYPDICSDSETFADFYLYVVAEGDDGNGKDIWYSRTTTQGAVWESGYTIGAISLSDRGYRRPDINYGFGGYVHTAWEFAIDDDTYDDALRYRRCPNFGSGGVNNWGPILGPTTHNNGFLEKSPQIVASLSSTEVAIACRRYYRSGGYLYTDDPGIVASDNSGASFGALSIITNGVTFITDVSMKPGSNAFAVVGQASDEKIIQWGDITNPTVWGNQETFTDDPLWTGTVWDMGCAFDPTHNNRAALAWGGATVTGLSGNLYFDAEWRSDPGYPNLADGFPVELDYTPRSDPALVDLNGDGSLEIVFANTGNQICAYHNDGSIVDGWPVDVGTYLSSSPVAIGDLIGQGEMFVVAGTANGYVVCYDSAGNMMDGFPRLMEYGHPAYIAIGNLGGFYKGTIVVGCGAMLEFLNYKGNNVEGSHSFEHVAELVNNPPTIGDYNNDGINEVICPAENIVTVKRMYDANPIFQYDYIADTVSGAVTLGDLNLDGDYELAVPMNSGTLNLIANGAIPGFPVYTDSGTALSSVAWANILGTHEPEMIFAAKNYTVEAFSHDGTSLSGYPVNPGPGWYLYGSPVVGSVKDFSSDVVIGSRDQNIWCYDNFGDLNPGWPKYAGDVVHRTPAIGDVDSDLKTDIVYLSQSQLFLVNTNNYMTDAEFNWPMAGYNPQRTGCHNCGDGDTSPVISDDQAITRLSFAAPAPNPTSGPTLFSFELPVRSAVQLEVFDVRGHRVSSVLKEEVPVGSHAISWNGRGEDGRNLASGVYFARLQVRGPGLNRTLSRKVSLLR